uniref:CYTH domain-containing protein n=1 Tax=Leersia perrieri TaxID=77586 RepID=A0A0D9X6F8_9ORYZ
MEVEIKLRLPDAAAHRRLSTFLAPRLRRTDAQRNLFFDAAARPLAAATAALRVRLYGPDEPSRAVLALKRRPRIDAGVSRVEEVEEPLDPAIALACLDNPARLGAVDSPIIRLVADEYGVGGDAAPFVCLGGFRNTRAVYQLEEGEETLGLVLELDETRFDFGTNYELECETAEPEQAKQVLERLLTVAGVPYEYSRISPVFMDIHDR